MKFILFSKVKFEVSDPVALIECYCFQSDFYKNYDLLLPARELKAVSKIGARIQKDLLKNCDKVIESRNNLPIFRYDNNFDEFLDLDDETIGNHVREVSDVIKNLMEIDGIGLPKATKILHTRYPGIIPMIDNQLRTEYRQINKEWKDEPDRILLAYYHNLKEEPNKQNLTQVYETISKSVPKLTKVRVFDILWWSFLKAKTLKEKKGINWSTIKW
jgi:hypothetical protein